ncbi:MAG: G5 domain-containing protein, partial [Oscillospiraceae bacterium]|nr:G5 domain-containing protein [Oscillospiraceae bacterium]
MNYSTVWENSESLYGGDYKTVVKGSDGEQTVTELVTYIDGVRVSSKEVSRVTTKEAVDEKIQVGTKRNNYYGSSGGNYNFSYSGAKFCWPGVGATVISSRYGKRALNGWHNGIDLCRPGGSKGAPVVAAESCKVI